MNLSEDELLHSIVEECEQHDSFERAAAIALWHGNIDLAVDVISRAMSRSKSDKHGVPKNEDCVVDESYQSFDLIEWDVPVDDSYQSTLSLVGVCFAGYHSNFSLNKDTQLQRNQSWGKMCNYVICELERSSRKSSAYLIACCCFLLDVLYSRPGLDVCYERIINNESLALEDRIGFGSIYLNDNLFSAWINQTTYSCLEYGNIEGILLCGFTTSGLNVIQRFIDKYSDLQTAALLIGRILEKRQNSSPEFLWLSEYRAMLNQWQMFTERALLDVQMGSLFRQKDEDKMYKKEKKGEVRGSGKMNNQFAKRNLHSKSGGGEKLKRSMYDLPQHTNYTFLYLRCNFCGAALPVDAMRIAHAETLRVQKSLIGCCANCKQRLPRCYVCQTQMVREYFTFLLLFNLNKFIFFLTIEHGESIQRVEPDNDLEANSF